MVAQQEVYDLPRLRGRLDPADGDTVAKAPIIPDRYDQILKDVPGVWGWRVPGKGA